MSKTASEITELALLLPPLERLAKYCDEHFCVCVCPCVCLSAWLSVRISPETLAIFTYFCVHCLWPWLGSPPATWRNP